MSSRFDGLGHWVVVANGARARVLECTAHPRVFRHVADLVHPQTRLKGVELARTAGGGDRAGHVEGPGHGSAAYQPRTTAREREHDRFARQVAELLDDGVAAGDCLSIVLVASDPALGEIRSHLGAMALRRVRRTLASDFTALRDAEVAERLEWPEEAAH